MHNVWWLSFADDDGFRGGVYVEADDFLSAVMKTHRLGINPGGECKGLGPVVVQCLEEVPASLNKLLSLEDIQKDDDMMKWDEEVDERIARRGKN